MDQETFIALVRQSEPTLYRVAKAVLHQEQDVEDAVQEGIIKAYQNRHKLRDAAVFQTWLVRIVLNECYNQLRKKKDVQPLLAAEQLPAAEEESYSELYAAIAALPPKLKIPIVLYYVEGYSTLEIKAIMKIPQGTVKSRLAKGRKELKAFLSGEGDHNENDEKRKMAESLS